MQMLQPEGRLTRKFGSRRCWWYEWHQKIESLTSAYDHGKWLGYRLVHPNNQAPHSDSPTSTAECKLQHWRVTSAGLQWGSWKHIHKCRQASLANCSDGKYLPTSAEAQLQGWFNGFKGWTWHRTISIRTFLVSLVVSILEKPSSIWEAVGVEKWKPAMSWHFWQKSPFPFSSPSFKLTVVQR